MENSSGNCVTGSSKTVRHDENVIVLRYKPSRIMLQEKGERCRDNAINWGKRTNAALSDLLL